MESTHSRNSEIPEKKVLIVAHHFPPAGGVGTFRVTKFVKYLPEFGWQSAVVSAVESQYAWLDRSLERDIPLGTHIHRLPSCKVPLVKNDGIRWIPRVFRSIKAIVREEQPLVVYLTGGPFFPFVLGPVIKRRFGIPYVLDFRDPWKPLGGARRGVKGLVGTLLTGLTERFVVRHASKVVCATEPMRQAYAAAYKNQSPGKFVTITNGFDPEDFEDIEPMQFAEFTIVYTGKFGVSAGFRDPTALFQALKSLNEEGLRIDFIHVGVVEPEIAGLAQTVGVGDYVSFLGPKPYSKTLTYAKGANILLVIGTGQKFEQTGKIFDYIGCGRPIIALAPESGAIAEVVRQIPFAKLVCAPEATAIAELIREAYQKRHVHPDASSHAQFARRYNRAYLAQLLAVTFDDVIGARGKDVTLTGTLAEREPLEKVKRR